MSVEKDEVFIEFAEKGLDELKKKVINLQVTIRNLGKAINTSLAKGDKSHASGFAKQLRNTKKELESQSTTLKRYKLSLNAIKRQYNATQNEIKKSNQAFMQFRRNILQGGLSIMFFGQNMKRTFSGVAMNAFSTFTSLTANTEMANNSINQFAGAWTAVKFTMGEALNTVLSALAPILIPLLNKIMEFIEEHPKLSAWVVILGVILGGVMAIVGSFMLLFLGVGALATQFGILSGVATASTGVMSGGFLAAIGPILSVAAMVLAVIAIFKILWGVFTGDEATKKLVVNVIGALVKIVAFIILKSVQIVQTIVSFFKVIGYHLSYGIKRGINFFKRLFAGVVNWIIDRINDLIKLVNKIPGVNIGTISHIKVNTKTKEELLGERDAAIQKERERLAYFYSDEYAKRWGNAASSVIEGFGKGLDKLAFLKGKDVGAPLKQGWSEIFEKNINAADKNEETAEKNINAADKNSEAADKFMEAVNKMNDNPLTKTYEDMFYNWQTV